MTISHFISLMRLAIEKAWLEDASAAEEDLKTLELAQRAARQHMGQYRLVLDVMGARWLPRIRKMLPEPLCEQLDEGRLKVDGGLSQGSMTLLPWDTHPETWQGQIIGLWGPAQVGKDTIQSHLGWPRAAFADALKDDLAGAVQPMGLDLTRAADKQIARALLVEYGRLGRAVEPDYWINRLFLPPGRVCVTDVRYLDECQWIWRLGGMVVEVQRVGIAPTNDEEHRSFAEIRAHCQRTGQVIPVVENLHGMPEVAAEVVRMLAERHFAKAA